MEKAGTEGGELTRAVAAACEYLVRGQDADGYWRDYQLAPGRSESWVTGCVGVALTDAEQLLPPDPERARAVDRAVAALRASQRRGGWGYNRRVGCDADSTSWAVRLIARRTGGGVSPDVFSKYITATGGVRTYRSPKTFGRWAEEHDEVAPTTGLALIALGDAATAGVIRENTLRRYHAHGDWIPFWWQSRAYAVAHNLAFLARSGGVPLPVALAERERLAEAVDPADSDPNPLPASAFETAQRLMAAAHLYDHGHADLFRRTLLAAQLPDGGWPASPGLLVPGRRNPDPPTFTDDRRLFGTAMSVLALVAASSMEASGGSENDAAAYGPLEPRDEEKV